MENIERIEDYGDEIKELFGDLVSEELYETWADTFEIVCYDKQVVVNYFGTESIKRFKKECKRSLIPCIYTIIGSGRKIKFAQQQSYTPKKKTEKYDDVNSKTQKNLKAIKFFVLGMIFVCIATAVVIVMFNYIGNRSFKETFYNTSSIKVDSNLRVVQLSDLHGVSYGKDNQRLLERVKALSPDIIICTGDMVESTVNDIDYAQKLAKSLAEIAPAYYIYGNNEVESIYGFPLVESTLDAKFGFNNDNRDETAMLKFEDTFEQKLEEVGMKVLKNEMDTIKVKTMTVDVYGVLNSNPSSFWSYSGKAFESYAGENTNNLKITAIHEPIIFEEFQHDFWGDLMVAGHTHGGLVRVPILGPLYTNEGGLLPGRGGKYVYGRYDVSGSPLVISGGLENSSVLRINNKPELVIIDIHKF